MKITKTQGSAICAIIAVVSVVLKSTDFRHLGFGDLLISAPLAAVLHSDSILWVCVSKTAFIVAIFQWLCWGLDANRERTILAVTISLSLVAILMSSFELVVA